MTFCYATAEYSKARPIPLGSARVSRVGDRVLAIADFRRSFWRDAESPIRTGMSRETRALPGIPRSPEFFARKVLPKKSSELINADRSQTNQ